MRGEQLKGLGSQLPGVEAPPRGRTPQRARALAPASSRKPAVSRPGQRRERPAARLQVQAAAAGDRVVQRRLLAARWTAHPPPRAVLARAGSGKQASGDAGGAATKAEQGSAESSPAEFVFEVPDPREIVTLQDVQYLNPDDAEDFDPSDRQPNYYSTRPPENWHVDWSGVSYNQQRPDVNEVKVDGMLHPPGFDPAHPTAGCPSHAGWPVLLLLPASGSYDTRRAGEGGDPLAALHAVEAHQFHITARSHVLQLSFPHFPPSWLADGPDVQTESFLLSVLVPHLQRTLGAGPMSLLGFAQGGWGAVSMLLRHSHVFHKAASWDAPLLLALPDARLPGMTETFCTAEHYYHNHVLLDCAEDGVVGASLGSAQCASELVAKGVALPPGAAAAGATAPRLALLSGLDPSNADDALYLSLVLTSRGIPHVFEANKHTAVPRGWSQPWLPLALDFLATGAGRTGKEAYDVFVRDNAELDAAQAQAQAEGVPFETVVARLAAQRDPGSVLEEEDTGGGAGGVVTPGESLGLGEDFEMGSDVLDIGDDDVIDDLELEQEAGQGGGGALRGAGPQAARAAWARGAQGDVERDPEDEALFDEDVADLEDLEDLEELEAPAADDSGEQ